MEVLLQHLRNIKDNAPNQSLNIEEIKQVVPNWSNELIDSLFQKKGDLGWFCCPLNSSLSAYSLAYRRAEKLSVLLNILESFDSSIPNALLLSKNIKEEILNFASSLIDNALSINNHISSKLELLPEISVDLAETEEKIKSTLSSSQPEPEFIFSAPNEVNGDYLMIDNLLINWMEEKIVAEWNEKEQKFCSTKRKMGKTLKNKLLKYTT